ncbi:MAG: type II secretion system protein [Candidatus Hydrogenedentes bacterium]|nr:type II secretion system protein [Candidatus Hydrogenedentota bacterium]
MKNTNRGRMAHWASNAGFTLIELLTVIAIIAVLAGMTAVAVPQYLNKAQETKTKANMQQITQSLSEYAARVENKFGYPPAYGYIKNESRDQALPFPSPFGAPYFVTEPYTYTIGLHNATDVYEVARYTNSFDSNRDGSLSLFEYLPVGVRNPGTDGYIFSDELYTGGNSPMSGAVNERTAQLASNVRPYAYIPFNSRQLTAARRYWVRLGNDDGDYGRVFDTSHPDLNGRIFFPPPNYDGFVLIGNGPGGNDGGILSVGAPGTEGVDYEPEHRYHVIGLRIAYLATRDKDDDRLLDFSYEDRKQAGNIHILPDGTNGQGPFIKVVQ